ncbi:methionine adenosyltransferase [bacterium]|nr:methionine adenosyltransferase [bacterium]MBU1919034.1 methionine adenosyltransferase [bacterium]
MMQKDFIFTSESVTEGHPDKVADKISDAVLDAMLSQDPKSRVACETMVTTGVAIVAGEVTTQAYVDIAKLTRNTIREIGYTDSQIGFDADSCAVMVTLDEQSPDISQGVTEGSGLFKEQGAGDQGLMFGYACTDTPELMPAPIQYAHALTRQLTTVRQKGVVKHLRPDGKSQVSVQYVNGKPAHIDTVVISTQHDDKVTYEQLKADVIEYVIKPVLPREMLNDKTNYLVNPTGRFVVGGPLGDCGLTGRKIIVYTYGGMGRHGGGAFSGKDPSKVDRSACYMARYVAKNIVAAGLAEQCELQVAYAIGYPEPVSLMVNTFGTSTVDEAKIETAVREVFSFKPANIIKNLDLLRPIYYNTAAYGHFGRDEFPWEKTDKVEELKTLCK